MDCLLIHPVPMPKYAINSRFAQKLDLKFDDGLPYTGYLSGDVSRASWNLGIPIRRQL